MNKLAQIGNLLKKTYRVYSNTLLQRLQDKGYTDLRASFLEILSYISENEGVSIKLIGTNCGLKKQTMTSHLNELEKRGYLRRQAGLKDKREQCVYLTEYGQKFKFSLLEALDEIEQEYSRRLGEVEFERIEHILGNFHNKVTEV